MNTDIRLSVGFWHHPKTKKTAKRLGLEGIRSLQVLWLWAAVNRPDGVLSGMDWEDIELAADWQGEERAFFDHCLSTEQGAMWVDLTEAGYYLHDWAENNPWASEAEDRQDEARFNALKRYNPEIAKQLATLGKKTVTKDEYAALKNAKDLSHCPQYATHMPPNGSSNAPAPYPAPTHKEEGGDSACVRVAGSVPEHPDNPHPDPAASGGPKKTDSPSKGDPEWRAFLSCWDVYPVKQGREAAWCEWMRLKTNGTLAQAWEILDKILLMIAEDSRWKNGGVPKMAKWLSEKGWDDEPYVKPEEPKSPAAREGPLAPKTYAQAQDMERRQRSLRVLQRMEGGNGDIHDDQRRTGENVHTHAALPPGT